MNIFKHINRIHIIKYILTYFKAFALQQQSKVKNNNDPAIKYEIRRKKTILLNMNRSKKGRYWYGKQI